MEIKSFCQIYKVSTVSKEMNLSKEGRQTRVILIDLVDEMGQIRLALFGDMIDVVADFLYIPRSGLPVLIIQLAKVNLYKGEVVSYNFYLLPWEEARSCCIPKCVSRVTASRGLNHNQRI